MRTSGTRVPKSCTVPLARVSAAFPRPSRPGARARHDLMDSPTEIAAVDFRFAGADDTAEIIALVRATNKLEKK